MLRSCIRSTRCSRSAVGRRDQVSICGIHLPKMKRPISSPSCFTSSGSAAARKRSARAKNAFSFSLCASSPCSTNSTNTRLSLRRFLLAIRSTCSANRVGSVTLLRTGFLTGISPLYTAVVHSCADAIAGSHGTNQGMPMTLRRCEHFILADSTCTCHPTFRALRSPSVILPQLLTHPNLKEHGRSLPVIFLR